MDVKFPSELTVNEFDTLHRIEMVYHVFKHARHLPTAFKRVTYAKNIAYVSTCSKCGQSLILRVGKLFGKQYSDYSSWCHGSPVFGKQQTLYRGMVV